MMEGEGEGEGGGGGGIIARANLVNTYNQQRQGEAFKEAKISY